MASISSPGIGSGLDVNQIVSDLIAAERDPYVKKYESNQEVITSKISGLGSLKSALSDFDDVLFNLKRSTTFNQRAIENTSSNFEIEAGTASSAGAYDVEVKSIAKAHKITTNSFGATEAIGAGTFTLSSGTNSLAITIEATDTLDILKTKINDAGLDVGITATVVKGDSGDYLTLSSDKTGKDNVIKVDIIDDDASLHDNSGLSRLAYSSNTTVVNQTFTPGEVLGTNGTVDISNGTETASINITATDTIENVVTSINGAGLNMTASLEDDGAGGKKLVLVSNNAYGNDKINLAISADDDGNLTDSSGVSKLAHTYSPPNHIENDIASNAEILINGQISATSNENKFENVIEGVHITVKSPHTSGKNDTFKVSLDKESVKDELKTFVESFNEAYAKVVELSSVNNNSGETGVLVGDSTLRTMMNQIRRTLAEPVTLSNGSQMSLSAVGIETDKDGTLILNDDKITKALENQFDSFSELFSSENGVGKKLAGVVTSYRSVGGLLDVRIDSLQSESERLDESKLKFESRLTSQESRLFAQFLAMDQIVASLNNTSKFLENQLSNLPGVTSKK